MQASRTELTIINYYRAGIRACLALFVSFRVRRLNALEPVVVDIIDIWWRFGGLVLGHIDGEARREKGLG